jgi:predicted heme/steroid binding protein
MDRIGRYALVLTVIAAVFVLVFTGPCSTTGSVRQTSPNPAATRPRVFSAAELSRYDGKNGHSAYVAVDGVVYDVTGSKFFVNGIHKVCEEDSAAGHDLSEAMNEAPKGMREMLKRFPAVGTMAGSKANMPRQGTAPGPVPQKVFTTAELAKYDGLKGQPAYVAADGYVYDVTGSPLWPGGKHGMCKINSVAGKDLTSALNMAPANMRSLLEKFPIVGRLQ